MTIKTTPLTPSKLSPAATIPTQTPTAPVVELASLESPRGPAATFEREPLRAQWQPFLPPAAPRYFTKSCEPDFLQRVEKNRALIDGYDDAYAAYLDRFVAGVESAPDLRRVEALGRPVQYDPLASLPKSEHPIYSDDVNPRERRELRSATIAHRAIWEREHPKKPKSAWSWWDLVRHEPSHGGGGGGIRG